MKKKIIEFYGGGCPDCTLISPAVDRLEKEEAIEVEKLEVWSNEQNKKKMEGLKELYLTECKDNFAVPSFYDPESHRLLCQPLSYAILKAWVFAEPKRS